MKLRLLPAFAALCALFAVAASSCRENTIISASVTPSVDNVHTFGIGPAFPGVGDTITLRTFTVYDDSTLTSLNTTPSYSPIGWLNGDVYSGNTAGSLYMQVVPPSSAYTLVNEPDSGYIILPYSGFIWGDTTAASTQMYRAYTINEPFSKDSLFYSFNRKNTDPAVIGVGRFHTSGLAGAQVDSNSVGGINVTPHLRIELTHTFLHYLRTLLNGTTDSTYAAFAAALPGVYIVPDSTTQQRVLPYFRLDATSATDLFQQAGIVIYKHYTPTDSGTLALTLNPTYAGHFTRITRNYTPLARQLFDTTTSGDIVLLQNAPGAAIDVVLPYVSSLPRNAIINKCELVITQKTDADDRFSAPPRILPVGIDSAGDKYTILDRYPTTSTAPLDFIDGNAKTDPDGFTRYRVNFPRELQRAISQGKTSLHLRISGSATYPAAYRLLAGSGKKITPATYKMALNIVYSKQ